MNKKHDYIQDLAEIRSMMERSSKFLSLSGWAGTMAGIYALVGAYIAYNYYSFNPNKVAYNNTELQNTFSNLTETLLIAVVILILAIGTAVFLSYRKGRSKNENIWNPTSKKMLGSMSVPLLTGGVLILILITKGLIGLIAPISLLFYGLALYNASKFTYIELKFLGIIQIGLGLISSYFIEYGVLFWAIGFGIVHIIYGIFIHIRHER